MPVLVVSHFCSYFLLLCTCEELLLFMGASVSLSDVHFLDICTVATYLLLRLTQWLGLPVL